MAVCTMTVRNTCPFPVTFYALAGPVILLGPNETKSASACAIWFSTRVQGPGEIFYSEQWESRKQNYISSLHEFGHEASDWEDGGSGAAAGSFLGWATMKLAEVFKIHNTNDHGTIYWGAKKEGVYGSADLVIYATLDPACKLEPDRTDKMWILHLERDRGQNPGVTDPGGTPGQALPDWNYTVPDLSAYESVMFFRLRSNSNDRHLAGNPDDYGVGTSIVGTPFNPIEYSTYWTIVPIEGGNREIKIVNTKTRKWLSVAEDGRTVLLQPEDTADSVSLHWRPTLLPDSQSEIVLTTLVPPQDNLFKSPQQWVATQNQFTTGDHRWTVETFSVDMQDIGPGRKFRLMHASTGLYLTRLDSDLSSLTPFGDHQIFELRRLADGSVVLVYILAPQMTSDSSQKVLQYRGPSASGLFFQWFSNTDNQAPDRHWDLVMEASRAGFRMVVKDPANGAQNRLAYRNGAFCLSSGDEADGLWVAQLETVS